MGFCKNCNKKLIKGQSKYCSNKCQMEFQQTKWERKWKDGLVSGVKGEYDVSYYLRTYLLKKYNNRCSVCGWHEINPFTGRVPLEVEHIDGDSTNNKEENLTILCPNCHSLMRTYKGANTGHGRTARKKYYIGNMRANQ